MKTAVICHTSRALIRVEKWLCLLFITGLDTYSTIGKLVYKVKFRNP